MIPARVVASSNRTGARASRAYFGTNGVRRTVSDRPEPRIIFRNGDPAEQRARQAASAIPQIAQPTSAAERWANYVLGACKSTRDPRTLSIWAHQIGVSYTMLCESCRLVDVQPRHARDLARVLRVIMMPSFRCRQLATFLDISDRRTLNSILQKAGIREDSAFSQQASIAAFLDNQQFIAPDNPGIRIIREVLQ
jgi:hypothetical protein